MRASGTIRVLTPPPPPAEACKARAPAHHAGAPRREGRGVAAQCWHDAGTGVAAPHLLPSRTDTLAALP